MKNTEATVTLPLNRFKELEKSESQLEDILKSDKVIRVDWIHGYDPKSKVIITFFDGIEESIRSLEKEIVLEKIELEKQIVKLKKYSATKEKEIDQLIREIETLESKISVTSLLNKEKNKKWWKF